MLKLKMCFSSHPLDNNINEALCVGAVDTYGTGTGELLTWITFKYLKLNAEKNRQVNAVPDSNKCIHCG